MVMKTGQVRQALACGQPGLNQHNDQQSLARVGDLGEVVGLFDLRHDEFGDRSTDDDLPAGEVAGIDRGLCRQGGKPIVLSDGGEEGRNGTEGNAPPVVGEAVFFEQQHVSLDDGATELLDGGVRPGHVSEGGAEPGQAQHVTRHPGWAVSDGNAPTDEPFRRFPQPRLGDVAKVESPAGDGSRVAESA